MKRFALLAAGLLTVGSLGLSADAAFAAKNDAYAQKKSECKQAAKARHFGVHFVKRDRWIKNCIAGHRT
jgi:hypothetical protein